MKKVIFFIFLILVAFVGPVRSHAKYPRKTIAKKTHRKTKKNPSFYWYLVTSNITSGPVTNSDCVFQSFGSLPPNLGCPDNPQVYYCEIGLNASQINTTTHAIIGSQTPAVIDKWRGIGN